MKLLGILNFMQRDKLAAASAIVSAKSSDDQEQFEKEEDDEQVDKEEEDE